VFGLLGLLGLPARAMHDAISTGVYATARVTTSGAGRLASAATSSLAPPELRRLSESREGRVALGALNGAVGDRLAAADSDAAIEMAVRADDSDPTPRLVIFVHGLCETDEAWGPGPGSFDARLRDELGYTPLVLRYNSGLHVSENGRALARLIDSTVEAWPVPVQELALVGHSMGGLVAPGGVPLRGGAVDRFGAARFLAGIKDLRYGSVVDEDWGDCDADELLTDRCCEVPFLETATYFIGATLSREPGSPLGRVVGDLLVLYPSASGQGRRRRIPFEADHGRHFGGMNHFHLLRHPAVYEQLRSWLEPGV
jgi:hypothetical protein